MIKNRREQIRKRRRKKRVVSWIIFPLLVLFLSAASYAGFLYYKAQSVMSDAFNPVERESKRANIDPEMDNITVLFAGVDDSKKRNYQDSTRTDALMLATFNKEAKSIQLVSIPRDSLVFIPEKGYKDKINHAYGVGGIKSTIETVEGLLDIPVDYYVKMNFEAFIDVIDALGGVKVDVPYSISEKNSADISNAIQLEPGIQKLDGEEALALARTRKLDNDIERGKRQQEIIKAIMKKTASVKSIHKYSDIIEAIGQNMETDLSFDQMTSFMNYLTAGQDLMIDTYSLEGQDATIDRVYYYQLDEEALDSLRTTLKIHLELNTSSDNSYDNDNAGDLE